MAEKGETLRRTDADADNPEDRPPAQPGFLIVCAGGKPLWSTIAIPADGGELELGRDNLGKQTDDGRISRRHARVRFKDGVFSAMDLGSLNGTAVDGQPALASAYRSIERCLRIGDTLLLPAEDIHPLRAAGVTVNNGLVIGPRLFHIYQRIARAAASSLTLHVTGESGSGKEHAARAFHNASPTARGPFVAVNCATIPEGIAERLLFGAKRGAFSGVAADTDGYIQAADGGTLFLDEVAELHATVQAKLLRVLESREVLALGALKSQPVTLRVVSASHRSLYGEVAAGRLREDLYYRIGRPAERVPSLRERPEEIPWLVDSELKRSNPNLSAHVSLVEACLLRSWPGNVRELLVEVRSAGQEAIARDSQRVKAEHLSESAGLALAAQPAISPPTNPSSTGPHPVALPVPVKVPAPTPATPPASAPREADAAKAELQRPTRSQILAALIDAKGNISAAARALGVHRTHLRRHIEFHGIDVDRLRAIKP